MRRRESHFNPAKIMAVGFLAFILVGAALLMLPFSAEHEPLSVVDAVFTSASAVCVTGLIVLDTPRDFSAFGQIVLLALIQIGGLGVMTFSTMILLAAGRTVSLRSRAAVIDDFQSQSGPSLKAMIRTIFLYTAVIEAAGAAALFACFAGRFPPPRALALAVFHSISAFCNAGFSLFSDSLAGFSGHVGVQTVILALIVLGGVGFIVLRELTGWRRRRRLSLHAKIALRWTAFLIAVPAALILIIEWKAAFRGFSVLDKVLGALFQAVTPRTAGFSTVQISGLQPATLVLLICLMFIGAGPGSTAGGVKITTISVLWAAVRARLSGRSTPVISRRTIPADAYQRAFSAVVLAAAVISAAIFGLLLAQPGLRLVDASFEAVSAFGTVGLSVADSSRLNPGNRMLIAALMYIGRLGPLTLLAALARPPKPGRFEYVEEKIMVG